jgi:Fe-S oxidoreductase
MTTGSFLFLVVLLAAFVFFFRSLAGLLKSLRLGKPVDRFDRPGQRLWTVLRVAFGQSKLLREPLAGILHFLIFWGFVILLSAVVESIGEGIFTGFSLAFLGPLYPPLAFLQETIGALVVVSVLVSIARRLLGTPARLKVSGHEKLDAIFVLSLILIVMVTMFGQNATRIALGAADTAEARWVSVLFAPWWGGADPAATEIWHTIFFWAHMLAVLGFLNYLPHSKHLHILSSVPNVYFSPLGPKGALAPVNLADETLTKYGATDVDDLTWKQLLNGMTCTECGRCTSVCPANTTGKLLNPKKIMTDTRARLNEKTRIVGIDDPLLGHQLLDNFITEQELWACTTCMACVQECPVMIEHVDTIVDLRRGLVLNESRFPEELKTTFANLERNFTPWAFSHSTRADWAEGLDVPVMASVGRAEILFWVGCAGAYDARYRKVARAFATLLKKANVDFAILGTEEKCTGDPARRMGNEYLAQSLITENIATLDRYGVKKIVVTCPHCMQALGKEYRQFGGTYEVVHHSSFLRDLIEKGVLRLNARQRARITFHDPCYLGRYNDEYDAPRELLAAATGEAPVDMPRSGDRSFCCGAGGGRMFMEEKEGRRVNNERTKEALALQPEVIGTGCPFCMTMLTDGVKDAEKTETVAVKDIAEIVLEAVGEHS